MIYLDPPYGIKFASNFQLQLGQRDVKDREQDLTREPEMVKAYRDTWRCLAREDGQTASFNYAAFGGGATCLTPPNSVIHGIMMLC